MARPLRIDVRDGWYHITSRGIERNRIFSDDRDRSHFLSLLGRMCERYAVRIHAYVLMGNHYHLLIQTPEANASQAIQWLNVSYSVWYNRRHERVGPLFQGRFNSVLIEGAGAWVLEAISYLHLNPVRIQSFGLDKEGRQAEARGTQSPNPEQVRARLKHLREYRWSSYRAYAGYSASPKWLKTHELIERSGGREQLRRRMEQALRQGIPENGMAAFQARLLLGSHEFMEAMKQRVHTFSREQPDRKLVERRVPFEHIVQVVEAMRGSKWDQFKDQHGDPGRDLVLYLARRRSGLTLKEMGQRAGGLDYKLVGKAVERLDRRLHTDPVLRAQVERGLNQLSNVET